MNLQNISKHFLELIGKKKYSYRIKNRILDVAQGREADEYWYI